MLQNEQDEELGRLMQKTDEMVQERDKWMQELVRIVLKWLI